MKRSASSILSAALLAALTVPVAAQPLQKGILLVSAPTLTDHEFARSVVLVVHHEENGSIGLIVNRPTRLRAAATFDQFDALAEYSGRVFLGGPVAPTQPLLLADDAQSVLRDSEPVLDTIHIVASPDALSRHRGTFTDESMLRVFAGHARWQAGQLAAEVAEGHWRVLPGSADAVFSDEPLRLYRELSGHESESLVAGQPAAP